MASAPARDRILDAAYDLFSANGIRAVGIDAILERSGVAKMTLYRHFPSKQELALAYLEERDAALDARLAGGGGDAPRGDPATASSRSSMSSTSGSSARTSRAARSST